MPAAGGAGVLVADDDPVYAAIVEQFLLRHGAAVVARAGDGQKALDLLTDNPSGYSAIVLDLGMPNLDGVRFLRRIAEFGFGGRIVIVSGETAAIRGSAKTLAGLLGLDCVAAFAKPADFDLVAAAAVGPPPAKDNRPAAPIDPDQINAALRRAQLLAYYQPRVDLVTGTVTGAEALARMSDASGQLLDAGQLINFAEKNGAIHDITWRMIEIVVQDAVRLKQELGRSLTLSLNVSAPILANENFASALGDIVRQSGLSPEHFVVELTESRLPVDHVRSLETLTLLRMQGFGLAIDDFGTGHSNIEQLRLFPFSELKIDRSFLSFARRDNFALACVEASVTLARKLSLVVVGEGVETEQDLALARNCGIDLAQGYLFARPMPLAEFSAYVARRQPLPAEIRQAC